MAATYFGTVRSTPMPAPKNHAPVPFVLLKCLRTSKLGNLDAAAKLT
eukprot:CAMPEP_0172745736 /NCGR_PEP_ID=MMETSP1074-20121228/138698_1 /TAXON_ID=2916 /ORGANISM="Ceratium fusus, Strain PA161109" /LENGTH=46 /DNA_ID= /DNA_START= /DNA_END= /DNA_ORIENTATION=